MGTSGALGTRTRICENGYADDNKMFLIVNITDKHNDSHLCYTTYVTVQQSGRRHGLGLFAARGNTFPRTYFPEYKQ